MGKSHDLATLKNGGTIDGTLTVDNGNGNFVYLGNDGALEVRRSGGGGYIDFHGSAVDYDVRIQHHNNGLAFNVGGDGNHITGATIDSSGRVTMPYQPSYMAYDGQSVVSSSTVVKYSNVAFNVGNHYNSTNGRFTAPVTGTYVVGCYIQAHTTTHQTYTSITFQKNGSQYGTGELVQTWAGGSDHTVTGGVILMQLNAGDYAQVYAGRGYRGIQGYSFAYLTG